MTFYEAAKLASAANPCPKEMWLTHYSPSLQYPTEYENEVRKVFANTVVSKDGQSIELDFEED